MDKLIITVAPTGSLPTKKMTPHVPITPAEIIEEGLRCEAAGASIVHIHARNPEDESASTEFALFEEMHGGLKERTRLIPQISTGGRAGTAYEQRCDRLRLKPEMASLWWLTWDTAGRRLQRPCMTRSLRSTMSTPHHVHGKSGGRPGSSLLEK
jgi:uncharacterized protein (DUF849 family)